MKFLTQILILFSLPILACADIVDHLKSIEEKPEGHAMRNIDYIYMINLDQRPEKWEQSNQKLNPFGIYPYRFSAVNGWELSLDAINDVGLKYVNGMEGGFLGTSYRHQDNFESFHSVINEDGQVYFCHCMARGPIGIVLSHLSILSDALKSNYKTIWIMEDDIEVINDPRTLSDAIDRLDKLVGENNWDVLFTDRNPLDVSGQEIPAAGMAKRPNFHPNNLRQYFINEKAGSDFIRLGARFGAYSMILRRSGIEKIFNFIISHSIFLPYDMDLYLPPGLKMFTVAENVVSNFTSAISDNGGPNYLNKK